LTIKEVINNQVAVILKEQLSEEKIIPILENRIRSIIRELSINYKLSKDDTVQTILNDIVQSLLITYFSSPENIIKITDEARKIVMKQIKASKIDEYDIERRVKTKQKEIVDNLLYEIFDSYKDEDFIGLSNEN